VRKIPSVQRPLISIITPSFHAAGTIGETLDSVLPQLSDDVEHLLIDACSTDGTLEIAGKYPHLRVRSERDRGIYDGMNKGAELAAGEWLLFLQADDWLPAGTLDAYREAIRNNPDADLITGTATAVKEDGSTVWKITDENCCLLTLTNIVLGEPMINARLIRRSFFKELDGFSPDYSLASDREFLIRSTLCNARNSMTPRETYRYRWHQDSSTMTEFGPLTGKLSGEHLRMACFFLQGIEDDERKVFVKWHSRLTVQMAMNALESGSGKFLKAALTGSKEDVWWITGLINEIMRSFPRFLLRGGKTRSQVARKTSHQARTHPIITKK